MADGIAREGFDMDLAHGEARETAFVKALMSCTVEHKCDQKVRETDHVFIEFRQKGRPSGINTTQSDWYAIEYADDAWFVIRTSVLKALARRGRMVRGGDNNQYEGALVHIRHLARPWQELAAVPGDQPRRASGRCGNCGLAMVKHADGRDVCDSYLWGDPCDQTEARAA